MTRRYGWVPDLPDHRDHTYAAPGPLLASLPPAVDLRPGMPGVYDQGQLGSCTANAIGAAFEFDLLKQGLPDFVPSRLFIYWNERALEGTVDSDSGAMIRDGIKTVAAQGVCPEALWPYNVGEFAVQPPAACYSMAAHHRVTAYQRVSRTLPQLRGCLANGRPVIAGISVYESFESAEVARTGLVPMPSAGEAVLGGHAVLVVGYDDPTGRFLVRNSWGPGWGNRGYFALPYAYLTERGLAADFWTLTTVSG